MKIRIHTFGPFRVLTLVLLVCLKANSQSIVQQTYCNPINLDYTYMIYNSHNDLSYRSGADPAVVDFRGEYYMFVTRSMGYWHSKDLHNWEFINPEKWYFQGSNAPAAFNYKDSVLYAMGDPSGHMSVLYTDNPKKGDWKAVPSILNQLQDPALFIDDDGSGYVFWGSSNKFPIRARTLDVGKRFRPSEKVYELFNLDAEKHGWERFGENHSDTTLGGYIEGPWITKYDDKYYMQYAAPGTQFNVYGDGVYMADHPLGPYTYSPNNPTVYKPGGFINGAGHGSTVKGPSGQYWHFGSMAVAVTVHWERRIAMFPVYFDEDGLMYGKTDFGDYPHYAPNYGDWAGEFTGWMLLSLDKPVTASGSAEGHGPENVTDENVQTFWLARDTSEDEFLEIDLEDESDVYALQVNFHDHESDMYGRIENLYHRYTIEGSLDGKDWFMLVDKSNGFMDVPNDYVQLGIPKQARYIRFNHIHVPTPHLAISGLRVFGKGKGAVPAQVKEMSIERQADRRDVNLEWEAVPGAQGYNIKWGIAPDKLYSSWLVYRENNHYMRSFSRDQTYYFAIEAFNENGIAERSKVVKVE